MPGQVLIMPVLIMPVLNALAMNILVFDNLAMNDPVAGNEAVKPRQNRRKQPWPHPKK